MKKKKTIRTIDLNDEYDLKLLGYSIVFLNDKKNIINLQNYKKL